jgi:hypothetical protein
LVNPLSKASEQVGRVAVRAVDYVIENRVSDAESMLRRARTSAPGATGRVHADMVVARVAREMATVGALTGAVAVAPGVGTGTALATGAADVGVAFGRIATMVMAVGLAFEVDLTALEVRKDFVYGVLAGSESQLTDQERKAGQMKRQLGKQAVGRKGTLPAMAHVNEIFASRLGVRMVEKLVTQELALKLATLLPLGIGAGVGAIGNRALVTSVGRTAKARAASEAEFAAARAKGDDPLARKALPAGKRRRRLIPRMR